jgi:hypothetical protein
VDVAVVIGLADDNQMTAFDEIGAEKEKARNAGFWFRA